MMLREGQIFAHFEIIRKLGEGGMGEVYLARDQKLQRQVALKTLRPDYLDNQERRERFEREAKTAASISHPNVTSIHDFGSVHDPDSNSDINYIVMEYVEGTPLKQYVTANKGDVGVLLRLAERIATGLAAAHKMNVVHRDLKPDNIIVNSSGEPKILDFGLAKPVGALKAQDDKEESEDTISQELTRVGTVVGTVSYMSPEQAQGQEVDSRSDVFSFGILLYRMVTGELPFAGNTQVSILAKILESEPERPTSWNEAIPPELERILDKCLQKSPADRYQDTRDLVVDLRQLRRQYDSGVSESVTGISQIAQKPIKVHSFQLSGKSAVLSAAALLVVCVAVIYFFTRGGSSAIAAEEGLAILGFENKTGDKELDWLQTGLPEILLTDLAQDGAVNILSQRRVLDCLDADLRNTEDGFTHQDCVDAAHQLGATKVLSGSFFKVGDMIRIDARVEDVLTGKILLGEKVIGTDPFALVDSLTQRIAASLELKGLTTQGASVATVTTSSPEAYKYYHLGMQDFLNGILDKGIEKFEKAIALDSSFALSYMRIGMAYAFQQRSQDAAHYISLAKEREKKLPNKEKRLLDVYADFWLTVQFDEGYIKLQQLVRDYPDDKESKCILAVIESQLSNDSAKAFALMSEVLNQDPGYQLALDWSAQMRERFGEPEKAIEDTRRLLRYHPESITARRRLASLYRDQQRLDEAAQMYDEILSRIPDDASTLLRLFNLHILTRDFEKAREYLERVRKAHGDDPYKMIDYYSSLAGFNNWQGKFKASIRYRFADLEQAQLTGDSSYIRAAYSTISTYYQRFGMEQDSALFYAEKSSGYATDFSALDYPLTLVGLDTSNVEIARPLFENAIDNFRSRMPSSLWTIIKALERLFDATCQADTAGMIEGYQMLIASQQQTQQTGNDREMGKLMILAGRFEEGLSILESFVSGPDQSISGYTYPYVNYLVGLAHEGLGNNSEAVAAYREMLKYWGTPEIELDEIKDARARLTRLTNQS